MVNFSEMPPEIENVPREILDDLGKFIEPAFELALKRDASVTMTVYNEEQAQAGQDLVKRMAGERRMDPNLVKFKVVPEEEGGKFGDLTDQED